MRMGMILLTILLLVSACSHRTNFYTNMMIWKGESEHWSAVYTIKTRPMFKMTEEEPILELKFKNIENETIDGGVEYTLEHTGRYLYGRQVVNREGVIIDSGSRSSSFILPKNGVTLTITWNGKTEHLVLIQQSTEK